MPLTSPLCFQQPDKKPKHQTNQNTTPTEGTIRGTGNQNSDHTTAGSEEESRTAAGGSTTTGGTASTSPQHNTATMQLYEKREGEEDVRDGRARVAVVVESGDTGPVLEALRVDRRIVGGSGDGSLPSVLWEEAEGDLHEKTDWVDRDVEALR